VLCFDKNIRSRATHLLLSTFLQFYFLLAVIAADCIASRCDPFGFEVVSSERGVEVRLILDTLLASRLMQQCDIIDEREEHVFDVVSSECGGLVILHLVFLQHSGQCLLIVVPK